MTYLTADELASRLKFDRRYITNVLWTKFLEDGSHYVRPFGVRKILYIWGKTQDDMHAQADMSIPMATGGICKEFAEQWFLEQEVGWKRSYRNKLRDIYQRYLQPTFGDEVVSDIKKSTILQFRAQLAKVTHGQEKALSPSWINQVLNLHKQILDEAADRLDFNTPFRGIKPLRIGRTEVDPFSLDEVQTFLDTVDPSWRPYFIVRFFSGMRTSEIDGLKWEYVDFDRGEIMVRETRVHGETEITKTDGSARDIQMSGVVCAALREQKALTGHLSEYVFCTRHGYPLTYRNVNNRVWYPTLKEAGLKRRTPYQTRHTAATLWLVAGESPEWIARQMGHANTKMLFTVYSRYVPNLTRQDGSAMERLLRSRLGASPSESEEVSDA
ncbi:tyrosine-type recombinase/integrase [Aquisalimonas sp. APHAB1-3]|uniref:tyrosine-type recombinase/integrase n=1 Tax=Aquisalimonas sp. APHAB1-3 TaxID=3402080 RepID=UPI003AAB6D54